MTANVSGIGSMLQQMQTMAAQAAGPATGPAALAGGGAAGPASGTFAGVLKASLDKISGDQQRSLGQAQAFELGASNVSLNDVMVDMQKANIGFQYGLQVRNKLVSAYHEIMQIAV